MQSPNSALPRLSGGGGSCPSAYLGRFIDQLVQLADFAHRWFLDFLHPNTANVPYYGGYTLVVLLKSTRT
jgi:hypothetical protein